MVRPTIFSLARAFQTPRGFYAALSAQLTPKQLREVDDACRLLEADAFDLADAVYWIAADYGGSESCLWRVASNLTGYRPGPLRREPYGFAAKELYAVFESFLSPEP